MPKVVALPNEAVGLLAPEANARMERPPRVGCRFLPSIDTLQVGGQL